ncbi:phage tail tape measure protein [Methanoregula sp.]|uniref:phage tail tape measure protein n=1 Tax=Methanoregula sp. TaxID=2052170 RepID=UPI003569BFD3
MGLEAFAKGLAFPITADIDGLIKGLGQADIELSKVEKAFSRGQQVIKQYSLAIGLAMEGAALTIATTTKYAAEMNAKLGVTALTIGSTTEEMRDLALSTSDAGFRLDDVVSTFSLLGRAGVTGTATIQTLAKEFDTLGDAVNASAAEVADSMIPAMYAYDIPLTEVGDHMDSIAYLVNNSLIDYSELASVLGSLGTTLNGLGFSLEDTEALLLAMTNAGIPASVAVRKLRTAISDYNSALTKSEDAAKGVISAEKTLESSKKSLARLERDYARALEDAADTSKEVARIELAYSEQLADAKKNLIDLEKDYQDALNEAKDTTEDVAALDKSRAKEQKREAKALADLEADYAKEKADLEYEARLNPLDWSGNAKKVADLEERYAERRADLADDAAESTEEYNERLAEIQDTTKEVAAVEKQYAERREDLQESATKAAEDYNKELATTLDTSEAVARVQESYADRFEDTNAQIAEQTEELRKLREEAAKPAPSKTEVVTSLGISDADFAAAQQKILTDSTGAAKAYADANEKAISATDRLASAMEKLTLQAGTAAEPISDLSGALAIGGPLVVALAQLPDLVKSFGLAWAWITPLLTKAGAVLSGSLFAGIAAGIALGLAGVWVLLKTGFLDFMTKLGELFGAIAPQWAQDVLMIIASPLASLGAGIIALVSGNFDQIGTNMIKPFEWAAEAIGRIVSGIADAIKWPINAVIDGLNSMIDGFNAVSSLGGLTSGFDIQSIPRLAAGGTITSPGNVMVGDAGPEILTLPTGATVTPLGNAGERIVITGNTFNVRNDNDIKLISRELLAQISRENRARGISS